MINKVSAVENGLRLPLRLVVSLGLPVLLGFVALSVSPSPVQAQSPDPVITTTEQIDESDESPALPDTDVFIAGSESTSDDTVVPLASTYRAYLPFLMMGNSTNTPVATPIGSSQAVRAIWVQAATASTASKADAMISHVKRGGFNTILYNVNGSSVYYRSKLLPQSSNVTSKYDPLAYVVKQAHANGLKVQAWWPSGAAPTFSSFRSRYPSYDIASLSAIPDSVHYLNYSLPKAQKLVGDVVAEIAQNYDVDGVHLDYIRYPSTYGHDFGSDDVPKTVKNAYQRLKAVKPGAQLTAAVMASQSASRLTAQNWADWLSGGYIDRIFTMAYFDPAHTAKSGGGWTLESANLEWQHLSHPERITAGLKVTHGSNGEMDGSIAMTASQFMAQVNLCKKYGFPGWAVFEERTVTNSIMDALAAAK